jgi:predicted methyltransferase
MTSYQEILRHIRESLKPGGRLVIAEPSPSAGQETRAQQTAKHRISSALVAEEMKAAGFTIIDTREKYAHVPGGELYYSLVVGRLDK